MAFRGTTLAWDDLISQLTTLLGFHLLDDPLWETALLSENILWFIQYSLSIILLMLIYGVPFRVAIYLAVSLSMYYSSKVKYPI